MPSEPGPQARELALLLFGAVALVFLAGDLLIFLLWLAGRGRDRPFIARQWSVAHLFLALQAVLGAVLLAGFAAIFVLVPFMPRNARGLEDAPPALVFFVFILPCLLAQQVALVGIPLGLVWIKYHGSPMDLGLRRAASGVWKPLLWGVLLALLLIPVNDLLEALCRHWLLDPRKVPFADALKQLSEGANALSLLGGLKRNPLALLLAGLVIGIIGPVAEEVFFRGFAYRVFKERFGVPAGVALSALLFAAIHGNPVHLIPIFFIGLVLAWTYERTGSLAMPIGLHCANNLAALGFYFFNPEFSLWEGLFRSG